MRRRMAVRIATALAVVGLAALLGPGGCANEQTAKGQHLYQHYCMHCHGENGRQNEGYNWAQMPDPRPKDLSNAEEMGTFKDEEIFNTISRDMKDTTPEVGDKIGDDEFAVPTMPTFKYTLSEEEIWAIVAYVRTLHKKKLEFNVEERKKELEQKLQTAQQSYDSAKKTYDEAEKKANAEADAKGIDVPEDATAKEEAALAAAEKELNKAKAALTSLVSRPKFQPIQRPDMIATLASVEKLSARGKQLYMNKYGCNACHRVGDGGGVVGPALDRAGFRLTPTWMYRWIKYPQAMKPETRMPNLGLSDEDARAVVAYLSTLRAPKPEKPIEKAGS